MDVAVGRLGSRYGDKGLTHGQRRVPYQDVPMRYNFSELTSYKSIISTDFLFYFNI